MGACSIEAFKKKVDANVIAVIKVLDLTYLNCLLYKSLNISFKVFLC